MIWDQTERLRRIVVAIGADPAVDQLLLLYDHPEGLSPEADDSWAAVRRPWSRERSRPTPPG